jgi:hypothetical protein
MSKSMPTNKERLVRVETLVETMSEDVKDIKKCLIPLKIKVYTATCIISLLISGLGIWLGKDIFKGQEVKVGTYCTAPGECHERDN